MLTPNKKQLSFLFFLALLVAGCGKKAERERAEAEQTAGVAVEEKSSPPAAADKKSATDDWTYEPTDAKKEKYDGLLLDALNLVAEHKLAAALLKMRDAKDVLDTQEIQQEIEKLQNRIDQQEAAQNTTKAIEVVLQDGKPEDATRLASAGLGQFGGSDAANQLGSLKRQADALAIVDENPRDHRKRLLTEAKAALDDKNLRAAVIAYEEALQLEDSADLRSEVDRLHVTLAKYDDNMKRAADLRRDPAALEDALAALREAQSAWDTIQVRQEIDNYTLALQKRRDRISVADFEVWGDVGQAMAGKRLAEELLPSFKPRFDLVEREQISKVIAELKLEQSSLVEDEKARQEVGKLAKVRYLVLGSLNSQAGITANARLVEVQTGLIVQTAKLSAPTFDDLVNRLPELAQILMMSDEQKLAREQELAKANAVKPVELAPLVAPPAPPAANQPVPDPIVLFNPAPPALGGLTINAFNQFQPLPAGPLTVPQFAVVQPVREKMFQVAIELGDNLFRRGRFKEAQFQFNLAFNLFPDRRDVVIRLDQVRPLLPPAFVVDPGIPVVAPILPIRPRMAMTTFLTFGDPFFELSGIGGWTSDNIAPFFASRYSVVDRGLFNWYMARLGLTYFDLLNDPFIRQWLGRALNTRYFLFGTVSQVPGTFNRVIEVRTHLIDVEFNFEIGQGVILVDSRRDLRLRLPELAQITLLPPNERVVFLRNDTDDRQLLLDARIRLGNGEIDLALDFLKRFRRKRPNNVEAAVLFQQAQTRGQFAAFEAGRRQQFLQDQLLLNQAAQQNLALTRDADTLRLLALQQAAALDAADRRRRDADRNRAFERLLAQANAANRQNNVNVTVQILESAVALKPQNDAIQQLALARVKANELAQARAADLQLQQEKSLRQAREAELTQVRSQLEKERLDRAQAELASQKAQLARDELAFKALIEQAKTFAAQNQTAQAVTALQSAQQLNATDEVKTLLAQALDAQAKAEIAKKDAGERARLEEQLKAEKARREKAEAEAKRNADLYTQALKAGQDALAKKQFDSAITRFQEAGKLYQTDVVLTGLSQAQDGKAKQKVAADAVVRQQALERQKAADLQAAMTQGQAALDAKQFDNAVNQFKKATAINPQSVDAQAGLAKAQQARAALQLQSAAAASKATVQAEAKKAFDAQIKTGRDLLAAKKFDEAQKAFASAAKLQPGDATATTLLQQAQKAKTDSATKPTDPAKDAFQKALSEARLALAAGKFDQADKALDAAKKLSPQDPALTQVTSDVKDARTKAAMETANRQKVNQALADVQAALKAGQLDRAAKALAEAKALAPTDKGVASALDDLNKARAMAATDADKKRRMINYLKAMDAGKEALKAQKPDAAIAGFTEAGKQMPGDKEAASGLEQAQALAKKMNAATTAKNDLAKALAQAQAALKGGKVDQAAQLLAEARKLAPNDPAVAQLGKDIESAKAQMTADSLKKQNQADYQKAIKAGRDALAARNYDAAIKAFTQAGSLIPGDKDAAGLLKQAEKAKADAKMAQENDAKRKADLARLIDQGTKLLAAKKYADAATAFQSALKIAPNDPDAKAGLQKAQKLMEGSRTPTGPPAEYTRQMQLGAAYEKQQRYADAAKAYQAALKSMPNDPKATAALSFAQHMADGIRLLTGRRFPDAAKEFEDALKASPDDATAKALLKRAKDGK